VGCDIDYWNVPEFGPGLLTSVPLLAFPSPSILVMRIAKFYHFKASGANKGPLVVLVDANSIENFTCFLTTLTRFGANTFDRHLAGTLDRRVSS
jgi:hypothetical protein